MKKIVANKIFLLISLAMIIFAGFSLIFINFIFNKMVGESVQRFSAMYAEQAESFTVDNIDDNLTVTEEREYIMSQIADMVSGINPDTLHISVADVLGRVLFDNCELGGDNIGSDVGFSDAMNGVSKTFITDSEYYDDLVVMTYSVIDNATLAAPLIMQVELELNYNSVYSIAMVSIVLLVLLLLLLLAYFSINRLVADAISPLVNLQNNFIDMSNGEYHKHNITSKYREIQRIVDEVDTVSLKISNSFKNLQYEKEKSRFVLDNMSQGIVAIAPMGELIMMNRAAQRILECRALLGENVKSSISDQTLLDKITQVNTSGEDTMFEYETGDKTYNVEIKSVTDSWYAGSDGVITLIILTDITSESQSANIRSEFFANASHELKTPLTAIKGFSELLSMAKDDGKVVEKCVSEITKNTDKMLALINDMLELSRLDAKAQDFEFNIVNLRQIADEVKNKIEPIALSRNIKVRVQGEGKILGVEKQIDEVLTNLMDNAIKYNNDGGWVHVNIESVDKTVVLSVADNGIGIDSKHHARLFERFYVADKSRDKKLSSTGLGLSIVKHIVGVHKGKISMTSKLGKGTKFTIVFPSVDEFDSVLKK